MAGDLNHVSLIGRLVRDPEIRYTTSGTPVTKFSIANNDVFVQNNEKKEYVNYFDINVWGNQAVNCEKYLKKGSQVAVVGVLRQNRWNDKATGQTRSKIEVTANSVQFLTPASGMQNRSFENAPETNANVPNAPTMPSAPQSHPGMIEDPWNDSNNTNQNDPYMQSMNSDDDIPF